MGRYLLHGALALPLMLLAAVPASAMTVEDFLTRANALKAKGMLAVFSKKEIKLLVDEMKGATAAYKADYDKAQPAGDPALGCPPKPSKDGKGTRMSSDDLLNSFAAIPREQRQRMTVKTAFYDFMRTRYPCAKA